MFGLSWVLSGVLFRNRTTTAISAILVVALALYAWHRLDRSSAVRKAVSEYVADVELGTARAQIAEANRRAAIAEAAAARLDEKVQVARGNAIRASEEIKQFEAENEIPDSGRVDGSVIRLLRGN